MSGSVTFGVAPVGQPSANIFQEGWWSLGGEYSMSEIDLDLENSSDTSFFTEKTIESLDINLMLGKAGYCLKDNWEVFVGFGTVDTSGIGKDETSEDWGNNPAYKQINSFEYDLGSGSAAQIGTKYTFYEKAQIKAGIACQLTWLNLSGTVEENVYKETQEDGSRELSANDQTDVDSDLYIVQIAPGISYEVAFGYSIYGGPLFQWVTGKSETKSSNSLLFDTKTEYDVKNSASFGGWVGLRADIDAFISVSLDYQKVGSSSTIGLNLTSKF